MEDNKFIIQKLINACKEGSLETVVKLHKKYNYTNMIKKNRYEYFIMNIEFINTLQNVNNNKEIFKYLIDNDIYNDSILFNNIDINDFEFIKYCVLYVIKTKGYLFDSTFDMMTEIFRRCQYNYEFLKWFLENVDSKYIDMFVQDEDGDAFYLACYNGNLELVKLLNKYNGYDVTNDRDSVECAFNKGHFHIVEFLLTVTSPNETLVPNIVNIMVNEDYYHISKVLKIISKLPKDRCKKILEGLIEEVDCINILWYILFYKMDIKSKILLINIYFDKNNDLFNDTFCNMCNIFHECKLCNKYKRPEAFEEYDDEYIIPEDHRHMISLELIEILKLKGDLFIRETSKEIFKKKGDLFKIKETNSSIYSINYL